MAEGVDVVCLGILVADAIARPVDELPARGSIALMEEIALRAGGCAINTATVLRRLGLASAVVGKVGGDPFGDFLLGVLDERDVDRRGVLRDHAVATSASLVLVGSDGERTFLHLKGANGRLGPNELDRSLLFAGRALHVAGSLLLTELDGAPTASLLAEARSRGLLTSLDVVFDATGCWELVLPSLPHVDLFCPSLSEARAISSEERPADVAAWLRSRGVREVVLTMGGAGCYAAGQDFEGQIDAVPARAVDGTGAGDAFAAGLLYGRLAGWDLEHSARLANAAGALATTTVGASDSPHGLAETLALAGLE